MTFKGSIATPSLDLAKITETVKTYLPSDYRIGQHKERQPHKLTLQGLLTKDADHQGQASGHRKRRGPEFSGRNKGGPGRSDSMQTLTSPMPCSGEARIRDASAQCQAASSSGAHTMRTFRGYLKSGRERGFQLQREKSRLLSVPEPTFSVRDRSKYRDWVISMSRIFRSKQRRSRCRSFRRSSLTTI